MNLVGPYQDGQGNTVTLNGDGSYTLHTPTADTTVYGPVYSGLTGTDPSQQGSLTQQLIDPTTGQRTNTTTWTPANGGPSLVEDGSGNLTQANADGSTTTQSSSGVITQTQPGRQLRVL